MKSTPNKRAYFSKYASALLSRNITIQWISEDGDLVPDLDALNVQDNEYLQLVIFYNDLLNDRVQCND